VGVLNFIAGLATIILALELLIATLLFAAVCGGLWFGLNFGDRKLQPLLVKLNGYIAKGESLERQGLSKALRPLIAASSFGASIAATVSELGARTRTGP